MTMDVTYRVGSLNEPTNVAKTAVSIELAKLAAGALHRLDCLVLEMTEWENKGGRMRPARTVIIDAEHQPGEWMLGWPADKLEGLARQKN